MKFKYLYRYLCLRSGARFGMGLAGVLEERGSGHAISGLLPDSMLLTTDSSGMIGGLYY